MMSISHFIKCDFSHKKLVPFYRTASSGTLALTSLYQKIVSNCSLIYIDDFAAFYHYEMAEKLISFLKPNTQNVN